jgi:hypothetical protein
VKNAYLHEVGCDPDGPPGPENFFNTKMTPMNNFCLLKFPLKQLPEPAIRVGYDPGGPPGLEKIIFNTKVTPMNNF